MKFLFTRHTSDPFQFISACASGQYRVVANHIRKNPYLITYHATEDFHSKKYNITIGKGTTGLDAAAEHGHVHIVDLLLEKGACPNFSGKGDPTKSVDHPLIRACFNGHTSCASKLLDYGADPNAISVFGTPLECIAFRYDIENPDSFLLFFSKKLKQPIELRTKDEMKMQHSSSDIKRILNNYKRMYARIEHTFKSATNTFTHLPKHNTSKSSHCVRKRELSNNNRCKSSCKKSRISLRNSFRDRDTQRRSYSYRKTSG